MTAPDPHAIPHGRVDGPGRRAVLAAGRGGVRVAAPDADESILRRALRATAAHHEPPARTVRTPAPPARRRRPERSDEALPIATTEADRAAEGEIPPILRSVLAARAAEPDPAVVAEAAIAPAAPVIAAAPAAVDPAGIAAALPFARLAAVPCPEGRPEPPICRPAAAVVSRAKALSPLHAAVRHGRRPRRVGLLAGVAAASVLVASLATAATAAFAGAPAALQATPSLPAAALSVSLTQDPPPMVSLDVPAAATVAAVALCDLPEMQAALAAVDAPGAIAAAGGAQAFRDAVVAGAAPCVSLGDSAYPWVVVNKQRMNGPVDFVPGTVVVPEGVESLAGGGLRPDAAAAVTALVEAARAAGAGDIALDSAFRSLETQTETHDAQVAADGAELTDLTSARPGHSEHQTGLAADLVACDGGCGSLDDFGATPQGQWVAANGWQYGWIVRYEAGTTGITGYDAEPWHVRYIGPQLAALYHEGGFHTLEEFWGLPAAPTY